ncbi:hypothetical protein BV25DRAFT_1920326 [Artomyces pyxidatus]|uniref:Uncharacterized protein n=1 Tax=Artomyces pyxidatus TaxID=48021 RepID=A0ACB8SLH1_9AGAM|nr:hypothetical protein BV25DRAFT_1920326 [Artomyces pyxidatus]
MRSTATFVALTAACQILPATAAPLLFTPPTVGPPLDPATKAALDQAIEQLRNDNAQASKRSIFDPVLNPGIAPTVAPPLDPETKAALDRAFAQIGNDGTAIAERSPFVLPPGLSDEQIAQIQAEINRPGLGQIQALRRAPFILPPGVTPDADFAAISAVLGRPISAKTVQTRRRIPIELLPPFGPLGPVDPPLDPTQGPEDGSDGDNGDGESSPVTIGIKRRSPFILPPGLSDEQIAQIQAEISAPFKGLGAPVAVSRSPLKILAPPVEDEDDDTNDDDTDDDGAAIVPLTLGIKRRSPFILDPGLTDDQIRQIQDQFKPHTLNGVTLGGPIVVSRESVAGEVVGDVAKAAETTVSSALKNGALSGLGTLIGGGAIGALLDHFSGSNSSPSKRDVIEFLEARSDSEFEARANVAGEVAQAAETTVSSAIKNGALSGLGTLIGGGVIGTLLDKFGGGASKREIIEFLNAREDSEFEARAGVAGEVAEVAETTISSALKNGALSGLGTLIGGGVVGTLLDKFGGGGSSSKREVLEYLAARQSATGEVVEDAAKAAVSSGVGKTIANSVAGALTGLGVSAAVGSIFDHIKNSQSSASKREILEYLEARTGEEMAAQAFRRELLDLVLETRNINELD